MGIYAGGDLRMFQSRFGRGQSAPRYVPNRSLLLELRLRSSIPIPAAAVVCGNLFPHAAWVPPQSAYSDVRPQLSLVETRALATWF